MLSFSKNEVFLLDIPDMLANCRLCPRRCGADRTHGGTGVCGASGSIRIARAAPHYWEEPCISGVNGSGTVFFSHCALRCVYCQNSSISLLGGGHDINPEEFADICIGLQNRMVHNINLVTPSHYIPQIISGIAYAREKGLSIPVVYNCSGYELPESIKLLSSTVDVFLPDFKYLYPQTAMLYSSAADYPFYAAESIKTMLEISGPPVFDKNGMLLSGVLVRHLLLPGHVAESKEIIKLLFRSFKDDIYMSIMNQYTPPAGIGLSFPELARTVSSEEYEELCSYALDIGIENAYIQEEGTAAESFIPPFDV